MAIRSTSGGAFSGIGYTNIGNDLQVYLVGGFGLPSIIPNVMGFQWREVTIPLSHAQMNGVPLFWEVPNGYEGTIEFQRQNGAFETELSAIQQAWLQMQTPIYRTLTCIAAGGGGAKTFTFTGVTIKMEDAGTWRGDEVTKCVLLFKASLLQ